MPQLDVTTYASQIFWLIVTFVPLYFILSKVAIPRITTVLEARQEKIEDDLARAERLKTEAEQVLAEYNQALDEARSEAQAVLKKASDEMSSEAAERNQKLADKLAQKNQEAEAAIAKAREEAMANIRPAAAEVATAAFQKLAGKAPNKSKIEQAIEQASGGRA